LLGAPPRSFARGQTYDTFTTRTPLAPGETLILGFQGGRERWDNDRTGVGRLALKLREVKREGVHVETVENRKRPLAVELVRRAFDRNQDGTLDDAERQSARVILYGHSFGGAAVVKLARELEATGISVLLTVQIDSVGRGDEVVPPNVARAANLFQRNGFLIHGEPAIRAENPERTKILGNFEFDYSKKKIDLSQTTWIRRLGRTAHTKMEFDPEVWEKVEGIILQELSPTATKTATPTISSASHR
jgi:hypothetical protein